MSDCLFCGIAAGRVPATILRETDRAVVLRDIDPQAPTHFLVIPRLHVVSLAAAADDDSEELEALFGHLLQLAAEVARAEGLEEFRLVTNVGASAGQSVFHLHLHVLGGRPMSWPPG
jgi:histidine triad (HIT) family protein